MNYRTPGQTVQEWLVELAKISPENGHDPILKIYVKVDRQPGMLETIHITPEQGQTIEQFCDNLFAFEKEHGGTPPISSSYNDVPIPCYPGVTTDLRIGFYQGFLLHQRLVSLGRA